MLAEIGCFALVLALMFSLLLAIIPTLGIKINNYALMRTTDYYLIGQFICLICAYILLTLCFLNNDFSVITVLVNSSRSLPLFYKLCAVWGGHEGSMLLWIVILSVWMLAVMIWSKNLDHAFRTRVLIVLGALSSGFLLFLIATSNPFLRQFDLINTDGRDLNPLLQDPGFLFHPPMLYMGYVGFAVAFSFAISTLWLGYIKKEWAKWTRLWTLGAWCFLTLGITLGSWWAYRELGWGGWWFWDPVENASFMPWLVGTALVHGLIICEKRAQFVGWTVLLALTTFSLSLIGTFLVRSGVLTSVHAFAVDPSRGLFILLFLIIVIGGSLLLFSFRANCLSPDTKIALWSRASGLLLNNLFLMVAMFTVLIGTVYPLIIDGLGLGKISVGAPYFNTVFVPLITPLLILMGVGIHLRWENNFFKKDLKFLVKLIIISIITCIIITAVFFLKSGFFGIFLSSWILISTSALVYYKLKKSFKLSRGFLGMVVAHYGVAITVMGITASSMLSIEQDLKMAPGDKTNITSINSKINIKFVKLTPLIGPNYHGVRAYVLVNNKYIYPEKRYYDVSNTSMTDAAIDVNPLRDIYIALGENLDQDTWSFRIYYKPLVRWIWSGGLLMVLGGLLAL